jgi:transposase
VTLVMGLDQHRGQITAEWIKTETGEVSRARTARAHREPVRRFLGRFRGAELEVALDATTGWRLVVEEVRAGDRCSRAYGRAGGDQRAARPRAARQE